MNSRLRHACRWLGQILLRLEELLLVLLVLATIGLACAQIGLRSLFATGISWADPLLRQMVLWLGLLGAAVATHSDKHISIDLASHLLPQALLGRLRRLNRFFSALVCLALAWAALVFVQNEAQFDTGDTLLGLATWQLNLVFPLVFALISLRFLLKAFEASPTNPAKEGA